MEGLMIFSMLLLQIALPEQFAMADTSGTVDKLAIQFGGLANTSRIPWRTGPFKDSGEFLTYVRSNGASLEDEKPELRSFYAGNFNAGYFLIGSDGAIYFPTHAVYYDSGDYSPIVYGYEKYGGNVVEYRYASGKASRIEVLPPKGKNVNVIIYENAETSGSTTQTGYHWNVNFKFGVYPQKKNAFQIGYSKGSKITNGNVQNGFVSKAKNKYSLAKKGGFMVGKYAEYVGTIAPKAK